MTLSTTTLLKLPWPDIWRALRDDLPVIAGRLDEVASIECLERQSLPDGRLRVVNRWTAAPQLPAMLMQYAKPEMLSWVDRAEWDEAAARCTWTIESPYFGEHVACAGSTVFQPAMGGRGARITFAGEMIINGMPKGFEQVEGLLARGAESIVTRIVASNFQKLAKAAAEHIEAGG
ncbi:MAG: hypothetical protein SH809_18120 [Rhodothermales bacterium]|nr:hypothetical protein [Rhodothermales bacterium]